MSSYILQTKYDDGEVSAAVCTEDEILNAFGFEDCSGEEHQVFDFQHFGAMRALKHVQEGPPFNFHRFVDPLRNNEEVFAGYSHEH